MVYTIARLEFVISEKYPFLGASPDAVVHDPNICCQLELNSETYTLAPLFLPSSRTRGYYRNRMV